jgi:23S rRNA pseudouridine1911/1915/1917 synthase
VCFVETSGWGTMFWMSSVLEWLLVQYPAAKRTTLKRMVQSGRVLINNRAAKRLKDTFVEEDQIQLVKNSGTGASPVNRQKDHGRGAHAAEGLDIVYEDGDILVVNKPGGLLTSTVAHEKRPTLLARVREYLKGKDWRVRVGLIHRLDREASGLLIFSKNNVAYESLKEQFFRHSVNRVYAALVEGVPSPSAGRIHTRLVELKDGSVKVTQNPQAGQDAITGYTMIRRCGERALLRVVLETGRKHQIRSHLSHRGWPIVGDAMYGGKEGSGPLMLAAIELAIAHPRTGERMKFEIAMPEEMRRAVEK